jgi:hypothetical protein
MGSDRGDTWRRGREEARSVASGRRRSKLSHWQRPARLGEGEIHAITTSMAVTLRSTCVVSIYWHGCCRHCPAASLRPRERVLRQEWFP